MLLLQAFSSCDAAYVVEAALIDKLWDLSSCANRDNKDRGGGGNPNP